MIIALDYGPPPSPLTFVAHVREVVVLKQHVVAASKNATVRAPRQVVAGKGVADAAPGDAGHVCPFPRGKLANDVFGNGQVACVFSAHNPSVSAAVVCLASLGNAANSTGHKLVLVAADNTHALAAHVQDGARVNDAVASIQCLSHSAKVRC